MLKLYMTKFIGQLSEMVILYRPVSHTVKFNRKVLDMVKFNRRILDIPKEQYLEKYKM